MGLSPNASVRGQIEAEKAAADKWGEHARLGNGPICAARWQLGLAIGECQWCVVTIRLSTLRQPDYGLFSKRSDAWVIEQAAPGRL